MNLLKITNQVTLQGGVTYNLATGETNPDYGFMVSIPGHEVQTTVFDNEILKEYIKAQAKLLYLPEYFLGIWKDQDTYYLDVSLLVENKQTAILMGRKYNQTAIWDNENKDLIRLDC